MSQTSSIRSAWKICQDETFQTITDSCERSKYLVQKYDRLIKQTGNTVFKECRAYERFHGKSLLRVKELFQNINRIMAKITTTANAVAGNRKSIDMTLISNQVYMREIQMILDQIILSLPFDWSKWHSMFRLMMTFTDRARVLLEQKEFIKAHCDLGHASTIIKHFYDQETMIDNLTKDIESLALIVTLKFHLLKPIMLQTQDGEDVTSVEKVIKHLHQKWLAVFNIVEEIDQIVQPNIEAMVEVFVQLNIPTLLAILDKVDGFFRPSTECSLNSNLYLSPKLQLCNNYNGKNGRQFVANKTICGKELVLFERPLMKTLFNQKIHQYCFHCCEKIVTQWPCYGCDEVSYCSYECARTSWKLFHKHECKIYRLLVDREHSFTPGHIFRQYCIFGYEIMKQCELEMTERTKMANTIDPGSTNHNDGDHLDPLNRYIEQHGLNEPPKNMEEWTEEDKKKFCSILVSLVHNHGRSPSFLREAFHTIMAIRSIYFLFYRRIIPIAVVNDPEEFSQLIEHVTRGLSRVCTNGFCHAIFLPCSTDTDSNPKGDTTVKQYSYVDKLASCIGLVASMFNHSCSPNTGWQINSDGIRMETMRIIQPGEPLTISYGPHNSVCLDERQSILVESYSFFCHCNLCLMDVAKHQGFALRCNLTANCPGPLLFNKYQTCLTCGRSPAKTSEKILKNQQKIMKRADRKFRKNMAQIFQKIHRHRQQQRNPISVKLTNLKNCSYESGQQSEAETIPFRSLQPRQGIAKRLADWLDKQMPTGPWTNHLAEYFDEDDFKVMSTTGSQQLITSSQNLQDKLDKLHKHYYTYSRLVYGGSYDLLLKSAQLIFVSYNVRDQQSDEDFGSRCHHQKNDDYDYHRINLEQVIMKDQKMVDILPNCLDTIFVDILEDNDLATTLVNNLNYLCKFFQFLYDHKDDLRFLAQNGLRPFQYWMDFVFEPEKEIPSTSLITRTTRSTEMIPEFNEQGHSSDTTYNNHIPSYYHDDHDDHSNAKNSSIQAEIYKNKLENLIVRLYQKLLEILSWDMHEKGNFFPRLHEQLKHQSSVEYRNTSCRNQGDDEEEEAAAAAEHVEKMSKLWKNSISTTMILQSFQTLTLTKEEEKYRTIYENCRRGLAKIYSKFDINPETTAEN